MSKFVDGHGHILKIEKNTHFCLEKKYKNFYIENYKFCFTCVNKKI
jgi:hypothetical protein